MQSPTNVVGKRVGAFVIDGLIVAAISAIAWFALTKQFDGGCFGGGVEINGDCRGFEAGSGNRDIWLLINFLVPIGIYCVMTGITGKTPGKAAVGIKVGADVKVDVTVVCKDAKVAEELKKMADALLPTAKNFVPDKEAADLIDKVKVGASGANLTVEVTIPAALLGKSAKEFGGR